MAISTGVALAIGAAVAGVAAAASTALGVAGAVEQSKQAEANARAQEAQMNYNKRVEELEASRVEAEAAENARRQRMEAEKLKAQQRALLGASGAAMNSGSPLAVLGQTALDEELKVQDIHYSGARQAANHTEQAKMFGYQAAVARAQRPSAAGTALTIAGNLAGGVGQIANIGIGYVGAKNSLKATGQYNKPMFG